MLHKVRDTAYAILHLLVDDFRLLTFYLSKKILLIMRASSEVQSFTTFEEIVPFLSIFLEDDAHQCCHRKTLLPINKVIAVVRYT